MENTQTQNIQTIDTQYSKVLDLLQDGVQLIDFNWSFIYVNAAAEKYLRKTKQQLLGHEITTIYPSIDIEYHKALQQCMVNRTTQYHEIVQEHADKSKRWFRLTIKPIDEGILIMSHNTTAQKEAEEETNRVSRLYAFISQVNQKIVRLKDEGKLFYNACNMALEFGKFKMAWIGMFDLANKKITLVEQCGIHKDDTANFKNAPFQINGPQDYVLRTGKYYLCHNIQEDLELESWKPFATSLGIDSCIVLPIKKLGSVVGTFNLYGSHADFSSREEIKLLEEVAGDISYALDLFEKNRQHQKAVQQLKNSEAFSNGVLNSLKSHIAVIDVNGNIVAVNDPWKQFAAENGDASLQHTGLDCNYFDVCHTAANAGNKTAAEVLSGIKKVIREKIDSFSFEYSCHSPSEQRWFHMNVVKFNSHEPMLVVSHKNITDRKMVELQSIKITDELIQRNKDLEQFTYIISHNLRAPVANIMGLTNAINTLNLGPDEEKQMIGHLGTSVKKLDEVIIDLNQILQVKDNMLNEHKETVRFADVLLDVRISIDVLIRKEDVNLIADFADVQEMQSIKSYLFSIFLNLVTNSIKYKQPHIQPIITISSKKMGNNIELLFKDNGLGIDLEKQQERVFGLYKRFHQHIEGKGIGLYMVKTQVETLGGNISIESKVNEGTTFRILLPL